MRAFAAIELPRTLLAKLGAIQEELRAVLPRTSIRWTQPAQVHLTLKFFGDVPADSVDELGEALKRACQTVAPFRFRAEGVGCFPDARRARVVWVGIQGEVEALRQLARRVEAGTAAWAEPEERTFHPHLTLARVKQADARVVRGLESWLKPGTVSLLGEWRVEEVLLMRSELKPGGAVHSRLARSPLAANV